MILTILVILAQAVGITLFSAAVFDALHYMLHRWRFSGFAVLRWAASLHQVHHDFLDKQMQVHPELATKNIWAHVVPEFLTTMAGTVPFLWIAPEATVLVMLKHVLQLAYVIYEEGVDFHHMSMDRLDGRSSPWLVSKSYHALHHINPLAYYGSIHKAFDILFGTAVALRGKKVLVTGATGAFGRAMLGLLVRAGARVEIARHGEDFDGALIAQRMRAKLAWADIVVLAHGSRAEPWPANVSSFASIIDATEAAHRGSLVPPEVWAMGSEAELVGWDEYAMSKRYFALQAARFARSPDVTYRHIVAASFASPMGWGPMSAGFTAWWALFLIRRGFSYVPVTWTGIAFLNWFKFQWLKATA